jgi:fucose permease
VGGAILPLLFGFILDAVRGGEASPLPDDFQMAYWIFIPCYLYILYYALAGHKVGLAKNK